MDTAVRPRYTVFEECGERMTAKRRVSTRKVTPVSSLLPLLLLSGCLVLAAGCSVGAGQGFPPTLFITNPADGSGNVPVTAAVSATFSRAMDPTTITASSFTITQDGTSIPGTVTCSGKTATFTPTNNLPGNAIFTGTITTDAKDVNGVAVPSNQVWTFMTIPVPTANSIVLYYTYTQVSPFWTRTASPLTLTNGANTISQSFNPLDGSVTITILNAPGYQDNGFYFSVGSLQYFSSLRVVTASGAGPFSAFFTWAANVISGLGSDKYSSASAAPVNGVLTLDSTTSFGGYTIPQLRAGAVAGVTGSTRAAIWLGFSLGPGQSQTTSTASITEN
jgi:hypothetical protein